MYYQRGKAANAGLLTAFTNRVGDVLLIVRLLLLRGAGSYNGFAQPLAEGGIALGVIIAAITKSAQVPFSAWLPAAMAAPTPVSSLVHSSTLVTAGVYLMLRFASSFSSPALLILGYVGALTGVVAGLSALKELDIKKVVALSTLRQLGLIITAVGIGLFNVAFLHLISHAFFKALLFIGVGREIHLKDGWQDLRGVGREAGGRKISPLTLGVVSGASLRLIGCPFLRGFFSKDGLLEALFMGGGPVRLCLRALIRVLLTTVYSLRLIRTLLVKRGGRGGLH